LASAQWSLFRLGTLRKVEVFFTIANAGICAVYKGAEHSSWLLQVKNER